MVSILADRDRLVFFGDRGQTEDGPLVRLLAEQSADKIVLVKPLHHNNDGTRALVIKSRQDCVREGIVDALALAVRQRVVRFKRIIENDDIATAPGQRAFD